MTDHEPKPEELLVGSDRPRPLPPDLRDRLEAALLDAALGADARPLPPEARARLEDQLRPLAPRPAGPSVRARVRGSWAALAPAIGIAAALVALAAIGVDALVHQPGRGSHPVAGRSGPAANGPSFKSLGPERGPATTPRASWSSLSTKVAGPPRAQPVRAGGPASGAGGPVGTGHAQPHPSPGAAPAAIALPLPAVRGVSPRSGPDAGGNWVKITGSGFEGVRAVRFGEVDAVRLAVVSDSEVRAVAPRHAPGTVVVAVVGPAGASRASPGDRYTFGR